VKAPQAPGPSRAPRIFGTDGIRDRPGEGYLAEEAIGRLVRAAAFVLRNRGIFPEDFPPGTGDVVLIGRDTRASGTEISSALAEGFSRCGHPVVDVGVLPTPGVAFLSSRWPGVGLGVVVSASHNPAEYNGIKFVAPTGSKISPGFEDAVSAAFFRGLSGGPKAACGKVESRAGEALEAYVDHLVRLPREPERLKGHRVALDLANGATFQVAPEVFRRLGLTVEVIADDPDGHNINKDCGTLHPEALARQVSSDGASFGFCFDGDGDRVIPVTRRGRILDGDHVLLFSGRHYLRCGRLPLRTVVATVMSNVGLEIALKRDGIELHRTDVGDRNVYQAMIAEGHPVGGEQSGHIIFLEDARTGDGILAAIRCLDVLEGAALDLESESLALVRYPQILRNVRVAHKRELEELPAVSEAVREARLALSDRGRVLLRYSGTEPMLRVMVEGPDASMIEALSDSICETIRRSIPLEPTKALKE